MFWPTGSTFRAKWAYPAPNNKDRSESELNGFFLLEWDLLHRIMFSGVFPPIESSMKWALMECFNVLSCVSIMQVSLILYSLYGFTNVKKFSSFFHCPLFLCSYGAPVSFSGNAKVKTLIDLVFSAALLTLPPILALHLQSCQCSYCWSTLRTKSMNLIG